jgi:uncharacterized protein YrzB (UPF0473 family)
MAEEKKTAAAEPEVKTESKEEKEKHYIVLTDEQGKDTKVELLFSIVYHQTGVRYLYVSDPGDEDAVIIFAADEEGSLEMVDQETVPVETMNFLQDTFQAYLQGDLVPVEEAEKAEKEAEEGEEEETEVCEDDDCCCHGHDEAKKA